MRQFLRKALSFGAIILIAKPANAVQWYVTTTGTGGGTGSWANACSLQYALTTANSGDDIWVAKGVYVPSIQSCIQCPSTDSRHATFVLKSGVRVYGGFRGPDNSDPNFPYAGESSLAERNEDLWVTTLSGDLGNNDHLSIFTDNAYHVVTALNVEEVTKLSGFTITAGRATDLDPNDVYERSGGGLLVVGTVVDEVARQSSLHVTRCRFNDNYANFSGAGAAVIWQDIPGDPNDVQPARFVNCTFRHNIASFQPPDPAPPSGDGGGAALHTVAFELTNCVFDGNTALLAGGGVFADDPLCAADARGAITNCTLFANKALGGTAVAVRDCFNDPQCAAGCVE